MAGKAIAGDTPIRDPKVGDKVRTETGGEGTIISNASRLEAANSHAIRVEYAAAILKYHIKEASYRKVFRTKRKHVPKVDVLAKRQKDENELSKVWATGLYKARRYIKVLRPETKVSVPELGENGTEVPIELPECCTNLAEDCAERHRTIMDLISRRQYDRLALIFMREQDDRSVRKNLPVHVRRDFTTQRVSDLIERSVHEDHAPDEYTHGEREPSGLTIVVPKEWKCSAVGPIPYMRKIPGVHDPLLPTSAREGKCRLMGAQARSYWGDVRCAQFIAKLEESLADAAVQWCQGNLELHDDGTVKAPSVQKREPISNRHSKSRRSWGNDRCYPSGNNGVQPHVEAHAERQMKIEEDKAAEIVKQRAEFFLREDIVDCSADEMRRKLRGRNCFHRSRRLG